MRDLTTLALGVMMVALAVMLVLTMVLVVREYREAQEWREFAAEHCRISGSYDEEAERATPVVAKHPLKVYHCDDGSIHVR